MLQLPRLDRSVNRRDLPCVEGPVVHRQTTKLPGETCPLIDRVWVALPFGNGPLGASNLPSTYTLSDCWSYVAARKYQRSLASLVAPVAYEKQAKLPGVLPPSSDV